MSTLTNPTAPEAGPVNPAPPAGVAHEDEMARKSAARTIAPMHPGPVAAGTLEELGVSGRKAAELIGVKNSTLQRVLAGDAPVTPDIALRFAALIGLDAEHWLRMQEAHDLFNARKALAGELKKIKRLEGR
jgi:addiction module HigA family antidote